MRLTVCLLTTIAAALLAGCTLRDDRGWTGTSVMTVHWQRYEFVDPICRKVIPVEPNDSDPPQLIFACSTIRGSDCYVYTDEDGGDRVGSLVEDCFKRIQPKPRSRRD